MNNVRENNIKVFEDTLYRINQSDTLKEKTFISIKNQKLILEKLEQVEVKNNWVKEILSQRTLMIEELKELSIVEHIYPSDANFILVKVDDANLRYKQLVEKGIIVRNRNSVTLCENCLRITIGTAQDNKELLKALTSLA